MLGPFTRTSVLCLLARKEHTSFPVDIFKITSFWSFGNFFKLRCFGRQLTNGSCFWFLRSGNELKFKIVSVLLWQTSPAFYQTHARNRALQRWKCTGIFLPTALKMVAENVCPRNSEIQNFVTEAFGWPCTVKLIFFLNCGNISWRFYFSVIVIISSSDRQDAPHEEQAQLSVQTERLHLFICCFEIYAVYRIILSPESFLFKHSSWWPLVEPLGLGKDQSCFNVCVRGMLLYSDEIRQLSDQKADLRGFLCEHFSNYRMVHKSKILFVPGQMTPKSKLFLQLCLCPAAFKVLAFIVIKFYQNSR